MHPSQHKALDRWLAAERDDRSDEADEALFELFEALPLLEPSAGFADRVLLRTGLPVAVEVPAAGLFAWRWARLALAVCVLAVALSVLWLPQTLKALAGTLSLAGVVDVGVKLLSEASLALVSVLRFGDWLFDLGRMLAMPLATPPVLAVLGGCLLISILAFRFLHELITRERSWTYVDPI